VNIYCLLTNCVAVCANKLVLSDLSMTYVVPNTACNIFDYYFKYSIQ